MSRSSGGASADAIEEIDDADTERAIVPPDLEDEFLAPEPPPSPDAAHGVGREPPRDRRPTVQSPVSQLLAASMTSVPDDPATWREAASPAALLHGAITNRIDASAVAVDLLIVEPSSEYCIEVVDDGSSPARAQVAALIERARACMAEDDLPGAVMAADEAVAEGQKAPPPGVNDILAPARALLDRIFAAYVGLLGQVPVLGRSEEELADDEPLDDLARSMIAVVDGERTLEQLFVAAKVPPVAAVRTAASLLRAGIIKIA
jgi:hypothetical protein